MAESFICVICGEPISAETIYNRHYAEGDMPPADRMVCSKACSVVLRQCEGQYKKMSVAGRDARSKAVAESNHVNPRRKAK